MGEGEANTITGTTSTPEQLLRRIVQTFADQRRRDRRRGALPLWARLSDLWGLGSHHFAAVCEWCGFNADTGEVRDE